MSETTRTTTRRRVLQTGGIAALAAVLAPAAGVAAAPLPAIDRAEALIRDLVEIIPQLAERDMCNVGHVLETVARALEGKAEVVREELPTMSLMIGEGNRVCDWMDQQEALELELEREAEHLLAPVTERCLARLDAAPDRDVALRVFIDWLHEEHGIRRTYLDLHGEEHTRVWSQAFGRACDRIKSVAEARAAT